MKFTVQREALLKPLQMVVGAVERRQTLPILSNALLSVNTHQLLLTATDLEVELIGRVTLTEPAETGQITVPARKLIDICRNLPDESLIELSLSEQRAVLKAGRSRFSLSTLSADDFPSIDDAPGENEFAIKQQDLKYLIDSTHFSVAQNDVRFYLNGLLVQLEQGKIRAVATDGHRLAIATLAHEDLNISKQIILPRKGMVELGRLLSDSEDTVTVTLMPNHIRISSNEFTFTSKLIDGSFPDYERVIPKNGDKIATIDRDYLKNALARVSILSNEKYRGVRFQLSTGTIRINANNPEHEEAEDVLEIDYSNDELDIGFNVSYILDVLNHIPSGLVRLIFTDSSSSLLIESAVDEQCAYVVMPMRL